MTTETRASVCYYGDRCRIRVMKDRTIRYRYDLHMHCPGDEAEFSLFCEVGEPYQQAFRDIVKEHGLLIKLSSVTFEDRPWIADELLSVRAHVSGWVR